MWDYFMDATEFEKKLSTLHDLLMSIKGRQIDCVGKMDERRYQFRYISGCLPVMCYAEINPVSNIFLVRAMLELPVEETRRPDVLAHISEINYLLSIGNFVLNMETGEVRFKLGFCFGDEPLTPHLMITHIDAMCYFLDHHIEDIVHRAFS